MAPRTGNAINIQRWKIVAAIGSLIPVVFMINAAYIDWHDTRYIRQKDGVTLAQASDLFAHKTEVLTIAAAEDLTNIIEGTSKLAQQNANSLEYLVFQAAREEVSRLQSEIIRHLRNEQNTPAWRSAKAALEIELENAENYLQCLRERRSNCEAEH